MSACIVRDHDPHGNSARIGRPVPGSALDRQSVASSASSRSRRPARPESARDARTADAVVGDGDAKRRAVPLEPHRRLGRRACFDDVRQRFGDEEVGGELDRVGQPLASRSVHAHRKRRRVARATRQPPRDLRRAGGSDGFHARARAARRSPARPRPARARATSSCVASPRGCWRGRARARASTSRCCAPSCRLRSMRRRSASVGGDDPSAGRPHLRELCAHLGREALVLEHEPSRRANGFDECRLVEQRRIVNEHSDLFAPRGHRRDGTVRRAAGARPAVPMHRRSGRRRADRRLERRVAECAGEPLAHRRRPCVRSSTTRSDASRTAQARPARSRDDRERDEQRDRASRSSRASARARPVAITRASHARPTRTLKAAARRAAAPASACRAAQRRAVAAERGRADDADANARRPPALGRSRAAAVSVRRDGEHVARVGQERARRRAGRRASTAKAPATANERGRDQGRPSGNVEHELRRGARPTARRAGSRASTERMGVRPLEDRRRGARTRPRRAATARDASAAVEHDDERRDQRPGQREIGGDSRARDAARRRRASRREARRDHDAAGAAPGRGAALAAATRR